MALILIVEDYPSLQKIYTMAADQAGHQAVVAKDGAEALKLAAQHNPNVILLDLLMPEVNGMEFLKRYEASKHPDTKIIVFSNMHSLPLEHQLSEMGVSLFLLKSKYTPKQVMDIIDGLVTPSSPAA